MRVYLTASASLLQICGVRVKLGARRTIGAYMFQYRASSVKYTASAETLNYCFVLVNLKASAHTLNNCGVRVNLTASALQHGVRRGV